MVAPDIGVVIPVRDRHHLTRTLIQQLEIPPEQIVVVDNCSEEPASEVLAGLCRVIQHEERNITAMWNKGMTELGDGFAHIAILNNDLRVPPGFLDALVSPLREYSYAASFPDVHGRLQPGQLEVKTVAEPINLFERMTGYAFVLNSAYDLWFDEEMVWHYSDDSMEWKAREAGGVVCVGGVTVEHLHPSESTNADPDLRRQAGLDRETFRLKWGRTPH